MVITVIIADDHPPYRKALSALLSREPDITVVGEAENGLTALRLVADLRPDVVIMDASMPVMDGIEATRRLRSAWPACAVLGISISPDPRLIRAMTEAGADGFVGKDSPPTAIPDLIRTIAARHQEKKKRKIPLSGDRLVDRAHTCSDGFPPELSILLIDGSMPPVTIGA